jgi:hypothetical protein
MPQCPNAFFESDYHFMECEHEYDKKQSLMLLSRNHF